MYCSHCKTDKDLKYFSFRKDTNKYRTICNQCRADKEKLRRILKSDQIKEKEKARNNTEHRKQWRKNNTKQNIERIRELDNKRYRRDKSKRLILAKAHSGKRRKRLKELSDETINSKALFDLLDKQDCKCYWCKTKIDSISASPDHYVPIAKGGKHSINNIVLTCVTCNLRKNAKDPIRYANENGRLF